MRKKRRGRVYLVGSGPGDPKLLTLRAFEVLKEKVDIVLYDRLVSSEVLAILPERTRKINVGKMPNSKNKNQNEIERLMISYAKRGERVARLKGGDALFFSRGGHEARTLKRERIDFEIVPGITSALGATAYAGIPLTDRKYSSSVLIATGHEDDSKARSKKIDWSKIPSSIDTIVILMGVGRMQHIASELIRGGLDSHTPLAIVERGTTEGQRTVLLTLQDAADGVTLRRISPPSVFVIGRVAGLAKSLNWRGGPVLSKADLMSL